MIEHCVSIAGEEGIKLRQSYKLMPAQRFRNHPKNRKKIPAAQRKLLRSGAAIYTGLGITGADFPVPAKEDFTGLAYKTPKEFCDMYLSVF